MLAELADQCEPFDEGIHGRQVKAPAARRPLTASFPALLIIHSDVFVAMQLQGVVEARTTCGPRAKNLAGGRAKLEQIEEQAQLTLAEYPHGLTRERVRLVMALAKQVRAHVTDQLEAGAREAVSGEIKVAVLDERKAANSS